MSKTTNKFSSEVRERAVRLGAGSGERASIPLGSDYMHCCLDRPLEPIGNIPPAEAEERSYAMLDDTPMAA